MNLLYLDTISKCWFPAKKPNKSHSHDCRILEMAIHAGQLPSTPRQSYGERGSGYQNLEIQAVSGGPL